MNPELTVTEIPKPSKLFLVWNPEDGFFTQYDSLEDAVETDPQEIYVADVRLMGTYRKKTVIEKVKPRGRPRKK